MIEPFMSWVTAISDFLWGPWTMVFIASVSVYLSLRSRFYQVRQFTYILRNTLGSVFKPGQMHKGKQELTPFQATSASLAGTVGMGNMAGVATALSIGGPGAIFWMWVLALLGMMTKTVEITLGVHYREIDGRGHIHGGPMYYIKKGLGWNSLATLFSCGILINCLFSAALLQPHTVGRALHVSYNFDPYIVTGVMALITLVVTVHGIKRIGRVCEALVPSMTFLYLIGGSVIIIANYESLPNVFSEIFKYAFSPAPALGGFAGATISKAIQMGMARGMLSNEAGMGTAPIVHANTSAEHPFQQGLWGAWEVFFDTTVVCTISALVILSTGVLADGKTGIELLLQAFSSYFNTGFSNLFISVAIATFCLTTQIGFYIYYETSLASLFGEKSVSYLKWIYFMPGIIFAGVGHVDQLWAFANIAVAVSALPNLVALLMLHGVFFLLMKDYLSGKCLYASAVVDSSRQYAKMVKG